MNVAGKHLYCVLRNEMKLPEDASLAIIGGVIAIVKYMTN